MPRGPRQVFNNNYYHILTRGNDKKNIFTCRQDYNYFINIIKETLPKHPIYIHHYCLMRNHVHFLIKVIEAHDVPLFFKMLLQRYAYYFSKRYNHTGYLFQNRYKSCLVDNENYLLECARYIERNPLRAGLAKMPEEYLWSSYIYYTRGNKDDVVRANPLYMQLAESDNERQRLYREYVVQERPYDLIVDKGLGIG